jgi:formate-dependent nitrite reductase membrane component NrfD
MSAAGATRPRAELRSYYGRPVLKAPVWTDEIPLYFFAGGLGGASCGLAYLAGRHGDDELARRAWINAAAAIGVSPVLLVSDLGRPARFLNMLRLFKVTSPMSVGSWILSASGLATTVAAADALTTFVPARAGRAARVSAAVLGLPLATYTGALLADTAVPVWHGARTTLPFVFGASAAMTAGAAAVATTSPAAAAPARRLAVGGAVATAGALALMERGLGPLAAPYATGTAGRLKRAAQALTVAGTVVVAGLARRGRAPAAVGGGLLLAGALCERWSIFRAGFQSAADPSFVVEPQRAAIDAGDRRGAVRRAG